MRLRDLRLSDAVVLERACGIEETSPFVSDAPTPYDRVVRKVSPCPGRGLCTDNKVTPGLGAVM